MAADYREAVASSRFLLHEVEARPQSGRWTAEAHSKEADFLRRQNEELAKFYAARTGKPLKEFDQAIKREMEHGVDWAKKYNLVHAVLDPDQPQVF